MRDNRRKNVKKNERAKLIYKKITRLFVASIAIVLISAFLISAVFAKPTQVKASDESAYKYYKSIQIEKGDTLSSIAKEYRNDNYDSLNSYIEEIKYINHLSSDRIYENDSLIVVYYDEELL